MNGKKNTEEAHFSFLKHKTWQNLGSTRKAWMDGWMEEEVGVGLGWGGEGKIQSIYGQL